MEPLIAQLVAHPLYVLIGACIVCCMLIKMVQRTIATVCREHTRREIAAYVAEGSMTAEQGELLLHEPLDEAA